MSIVPRISHGILSLTIESKDDLYKSYMPFISGGGLFIPTDQSYQLGEEVFALVTLMDEPNKVPVTGKVIWVTPPTPQGGRKQGIGIQFSEQDAALVSKIETFLAGTSESEKRTLTL